MIRRLRIKFVCINMAIVTIMLCVIFGMVIHLTSANMEKESLGIMQTAVLNPLQAGVLIKGDPAVRLPYFALQFGPDGDLLASGCGYYDLTDQELLHELAVLSSARKSGVLPEYNLRFIRVMTPASQYIVFADISSEINTMNHLFQNCLLIGAASFIIFLIISILLSFWATKPVESAWTQQRQFVADASHELKTPLTVILSNAQMLAKNGEDPALRERLTSNLVTVSEQMKDLVSKLLNSAQVDSGIEKRKFSVFDFSKTVANAILPFDPVFYERELELTSSIQDGIWMRASQAHLAQLVEILLDNAQKYSSIHGQTTVTLERSGRRRCLLKVENEGPEISAVERKNIFKRFYRGDKARERTGSYGLGLSIAEGIVKAHHGKIWAESRNGINSFYIQLPINR